MSRGGPSDLSGIFLIDLDDGFYICTFVLLHVLQSIEVHQFLSYTKLTQRTLTCKTSGTLRHFYVFYLQSESSVGQSTFNNHERVS